MDWQEMKTPNGEVYFINARTPRKATRMISEAKFGKGWECRSGGKRRGRQWFPETVGFAPDAETAERWLRGERVQLH